MSLVQYPIVVRLPAGMAWASVIFAIVMAIGGVGLHVWNLHAGEVGTPRLTLALAVGGSLFAVYAVLSVWKSAVRLHADRIEVVGAFRTAVRALADVTGVREGTSDSFVLGTREGVRPLLAPRWALRNEGFAAWVHALPNLDVIEAEAAQAELVRDERLGGTDAQRLANLERLRRVGRLLNLAGCAVGVWLMFWPEPYRVAVWAAGLAPVLAFVLALWRPGLFTLVGRGNIEVNANLTALLGTPAMALALRAMLDVHLADLGPTLLAAAIAAGVGLAVGMAADEGVRTRFGAAFLGVILFAWAWGGGVLLNVLLDHAPPRVVPAVVTAHGGEAYDKPRLTLRAEGRLYEDIDVPTRRWEALRDGDPICLLEFQGRFGWRYLGVGGACDGGPVLPIVPV